MNENEQASLISDAWQAIKAAIETGKIKTKSGRVIELGPGDYIRAAQWVANLRPPRSKRVPVVADFKPPRVTREADKSA